MGIGKKSKEKNDLPKIDNAKSWRKRMIMDVLGDDILERNLLDENSDQQTDDAFVERLLAEDVDREELEANQFREHLKNDNLDDRLEAYYADQKKSDLKALEYYQQDHGYERLLTLLKYRWEFLRRSPEYLAAFKLDRDKEETENHAINIFKRYEYWKAFGLLCSELPDPGLSFEELQNSKHEDISQEPVSRLNLINKNYRKEAGVSYFTFLDDELDVEQFNEIQINIDFTKLQSIKAVKGMIGKIIDDHWNDYYRRTGGRSTSVSIDVYDRILTVGDLTDKEGLSYREIAAKIFKSVKSDKSAERKVADYYKKYLEMINGGYRMI